MSSIGSAVFLHATLLVPRLNILNELRLSSWIETGHFCGRIYINICIHVYRFSRSHTFGLLYLPTYLPHAILFFFFLLFVIRAAGVASLQAEESSRGRGDVWGAVSGPEQRHPPPRTHSAKHLRRRWGTAVYPYMTYLYTWRWWGMRTYWLLYIRLRNICVRRCWRGKMTVRIYVASTTLTKYADVRT